MAAQIFRDAVDLGGTISAEHGLGALKKEYAGLEHAAASLDLMRAIKAAFDPRSILNPHKVLPEAGPREDFLERLPDPQRLMVILSTRKAGSEPFWSAQGVYVDWRERSVSFKRRAAT